MTQGIAQKLWDELSTRQTAVTPFDPPTEWLDDLPRRVKRGDLPDGVFLTNAKEALREVNRQRLGQMFIAYRRSLGGHALRGFIPQLVHTAGEPRVWGAVAAGSWVRAADAPATAEGHARLSLSSHLATAARLHGGALVALGICSWADVKADGVRQWATICDELAAQEEGGKEQAA